MREIQQGGTNKTKRFTETTKWSDPWFWRLPIEYKLLWIYVCDNCDASGVIDFCAELASAHIGHKFLDDRCLGAFGSRVLKLENAKWQIVKFMPFQYGTVDANCPAHKPVIRSILANGLKYPINNLSDRVSNTLQDKDKDKNKNKKGECEGKTFPFGAGTFRDESVLRKFNDDWVPCRKAMGKKPKDWSVMFNEQVHWLSAFVPAEQIEILSASIRNNWQGLFEPNRGHKRADKAAQEPWKHFNKDGRRVDASERIMDSNQIRDEDEYHEAQRRRHGA